jgi:hypothetical protein
LNFAFLKVPYLPPSKHICIQKGRCGDLPKNIKSTLHGPHLDGEEEETRESIKTNKGRRWGERGKMKKRKDVDN